MAEPAGGRAPEVDKSPLPESSSASVMDGSGEDIFPERMWQALIIGSTAAVLLFSVYCLSNDITIIFMHLYYFPIVLLAYRYRYRGLALATLLSLTYVWLVYFFGANHIDVLIGAWLRFFVFIGIAAVVAYLSENLSTARDKLKNYVGIQQGIIQNANVWLMVLDKDGSIREWNRAAETISGYAADEVRGKNTIWTLLYPEKDYRREITRKITEIVEKNNYFENLKTTITAKDGTEKDLLWNTKELPREAGQVRRYIAVGVDITDRTRAEETLRESEAKYRTLFDNMLEGFAYCRMLYDREGRPSDFIYLSVNPSFDRIIGTKAVTGKPVSEIFPGIKEAFPSLFGIYGRVASTGVPESFDLDFKPSGKWLHISVYSPKKGYFVAVFEDITQRKKAEDYLIANEEKFRQFFNNVSDALYIHSVDENGFPGTFIEVNTVMCDRLGYSRAELMMMSVQDILSETGRQKMPVVAEEMAKNGRATFETEHCRKDGSTVPVEASSVIFSLAGRQVAMVSARDITERKRMEDALARSEELYRTLAESSPDQIFINDRNETILYSNTTGLKLFGLPYDQVIGKKRGDLFPPEMAREQRAAFEKVFKTGEPLRRESIIRFGEQERWIDTNLVPLKDKAGLVTAVLGVARDITERKRMEEDLRQNEVRLATAMDLSKVVNWEYDVPAGIFTFNDRFYALYGTTAEREGGYLMPADVYAREFVHPDDAHMVADEVKDALTTTDPDYTRQIEHRIIRRDGTIRHIVVRIAITKDAEGRTVKTHGANQDITERKQMEVALRESRQLFSDIISFLPDPTLVIDSGGRVLAWNLALEQISGIPSEEIVGKGDYEYSLWQYGIRRPILIDLVLHPDLDNSNRGYTNIRKDGFTVTAETVISGKNGKKITFSLVASPLSDTSGNVIGAIESLRDITQFKEAEAELVRFNATLEQMVKERTSALVQEVAQRKKAEEDVQGLLRYTRSVIEANPDMMVVISPEGILLDVNAATENLTGIPRQNLIGTLYTGYFIDDGTLTEHFSSLIRDGKVENVSLEARHVDGHIIPIFASASVMKDSVGNIERIIAVAHDITKQKQDEAKIRASLEEKVVLLREIHHRVKNNLQIIISLLSLQSRTLTDPGIIAALKESTQRIRAMSMVHEKLYTGKDLSRIGFRNYITSLVNSQIAFYEIKPGKVRLDISGEDIMLDINTAIPLGLVVNELVSNALKHAFPGERKGTIKIEALMKNDLLEISVGDDGVGIPESFDWQTIHSLGLRLVNSLVTQLNGTILLNREGGTLFRISIPVKER